MKTIIQLAIAALVLNAAFQTGRVYWNFYEFKDAIQQEALRGKEKTTSALHKRVVALASESGVPVKWEDVRISVAQQETTIDVKYDQPIPLAPGYSQIWPFAASVSGTPMRALTVDEIVR